MSHIVLSVDFGKLLWNLVSVTCRGRIHPLVTRAPTKNAFSYSLLCIPFHVTWMFLIVGKMFMYHSHKYIRKTCMVYFVTTNIFKLVKIESLLQNYIFVKGVNTYKKNIPPTYFILISITPTFMKHSIVQLSFKLIHTLINKITTKLNNTVFSLIYTCNFFKWYAQKNYTSVITLHNIN